MENTEIHTQTAQDSPEEQENPSAAADIPENNDAPVHRETQLEQSHRLVYRKPSELIPYINNSRTHSDEQISQLAGSIREFGFVNPILVDGENNVIAGHGRLMAAQKLGLDLIPCINLHGLSEAQRKAYIIADNSLALNAGWDDDKLGIELMGLQELDFNIKLLGLDDDFVKLLLDDTNFPPGDEGDQGRLDQNEPQFVECPECSHVFDVKAKD